MDRGAWVGFSPWGHKSQARLSDWSTSTFMVRLRTGEITSWIVCLEARRQTPRPEPRSKLFLFYAQPPWQIHRLAWNEGNPETYIQNDYCIGVQQYFHRHVRQAARLLERVCLSGPLQRAGLRPCGPQGLSGEGAPSRPEQVRGLCGCPSRSLCHRVRAGLPCRPGERGCRLPPTLRRTAAPPVSLCRLLPAPAPRFALLFASAANSWPNPAAPARRVIQLSH